MDSNFMWKLKKLLTIDWSIEEVKPGPEGDRPDASPSSATKAGGVPQPPSKLGSFRESRKRGGKDTAKGRKGKKLPIPRV